jgi:hypothetical protein
VSYKKLVTLGQAVYLSRTKVLKMRTAYRSLIIVMAVMMPAVMFAGLMSAIPIVAVIQLFENLSPIPVVIDCLELGRLLFIFLDLRLFLLISLYVLIFDLFTALNLIVGLIRHHDVIGLLNLLSYQRCSRGFLNDFWGRQGDGSNILSSYGLNNRDSLQRIGEDRRCQLSELDGLGGTQKGSKTDCEGNDELFLDHISLYV